MDFVDGSFSSFLGVAEQVKVDKSSLSMCVQLQVDFVDTSSFSLYHCYSLRFNNHLSEMIVHCEALYVLMVLLLTCTLVIVTMDLELLMATFPLNCIEKICK